MRLAPRVFTLVTALAAFARADSSVPGVARPGTPAIPERLCDRDGPGLDRAARALAEPPRDLVLRISNLQIPIHRPTRREESELTAAGACTPKVECVRVDATRMKALALRFSTLLRVRHVGRSGSPHYGARSIEARWSGGSCEIADSFDAVLAEDDRRRFFEVQGEIVAALIAARPPAPPANREKKGP